MPSPTPELSSARYDVDQPKSCQLANGIGSVVVVVVDEVEVVVVVPGTVVVVVDEVEVDVDVVVVVPGTSVVVVVVEEYKPGVWQTSQLYNILV